MSPGGEHDPGPRILVLAPNWLGDVVMATPMLNLLRSSVFGARAGRARLALAVRRRWSPLFSRDPRLDELLMVERTGRHSGVRGLVRLASDLHGMNAGGIVLGPPSWRAGAAAWLARIPQRVGYRTDARGMFLNAGLDFPGRGRGHFSRQLLALGEELVRRLGGRPGSQEEALAAPMLPGLVPEDPPGLKEGPPVWVMGVGTTYGNAKMWPRSRTEEFLTAAVDRFHVRIVLLGDGRSFGRRPGEAAGVPLPPVRGDLAGGPGIVDMIGRTTLPQVAGILGGARVFVGNDSGLMHLAAALGTPTVGIFGSSDPHWTAPLGPWTQVVAPEGFPCSPCFRPTCNQPRFCLDALTADRVLSAACDVMAAAGDSPVEGKA